MKVTLWFVSEQFHQIDIFETFVCIKTFTICHSLICVRTGLPNKCLQAADADAAEDLFHFTAQSLPADEPHTKLPKNVIVAAGDVVVSNGEFRQRSKLPQGPLYQPVSAGPTLLKCFAQNPVIRQY